MNKNRKPATGEARVATPALSFPSLLASLHKLVEQQCTQLVYWVYLFGRVGRTTMHTVYSEYLFGQIGRITCLGQYTTLGKVNTHIVVRFSTQISHDCISKSCFFIQLINSPDRAVCETSRVTWHQSKVYIRTNLQNILYSDRIYLFQTLKGYCL